jgi:hypothetical protein
MAKIKEIPENVNRFKLIGDLIEVSGDRAIVETKMLSPITGKAYVDQYPIEVNAEIREKLAGLEGTTVGIVGYVDHPADTANSHLSALEAKPLPNGTHYNRAQLTGTVYNADIMARTEDKKAMANVSLIVASRILNAVTWRGAVTELKKEGVRRDAVVTIKGRARLREYELKGDLYKTIELTCDQSQDVEVHYVPPMTDEFSLDDKPVVSASAKAQEQSATSKNPNRRQRKAV